MLMLLMLVLNAWLGLFFCLSFVSRKKRSTEKDWSAQVVMASKNVAALQTHFWSRAGKPDSKKITGCLLKD